MQMKDPDNSMMNHRSINGLVYCEFVGGGEKDEKMAGDAARRRRHPEGGEWDVKNCSRRKRGKGTKDPSRRTPLASNSSAAGRSAQSFFPTIFFRVLFLSLNSLILNALQRSYLISSFHLSPSSIPDFSPLSRPFLF